MTRIEQIARVVARSRVYATEPIGPPQPEYLNAAVALTWDAAPLDLLDALAQIELDLGRIRGERWGPRTVDLDVLWIEGQVVDHPRLVVPHPRLRERAFALAPLLDVAPGATDPRSGVAYVLPPGAVRDTGFAF